MECAGTIALHDLLSNCSAATTSQTLDANGVIATVSVDVCRPCTLFRFDSMEDVRLNPNGVLDLFRMIGATGVARNALASNARCPRCRHALAYTHDVQRTTRRSTCAATARARTALFALARTQPQPHRNGLLSAGATAIGAFLDRLLKT